MRRAVIGALAGVAAVLSCAAAASAAAPVTPAGWRVTPAGSEIPISQGDLGLQGALGGALSPDGSANLAPYTAIQPAVVPFGAPGAPTNGANAPMAREAATWDLEAADETPEVALNQAIWKSIKGRHSRMPRPRHEHIIGSTPNDEEDEFEGG